MKIIKWLIDWFEKNSDVLRDDIEQNINESYFLRGWIDSLKFINLITDIEEEFKITFSNDEFQNREFATLNGLTDIIKKKYE